MIDQSGDWHSSVRIDCTSEQRGGSPCTVVRIAGEIDLATAPKLDEIVQFVTKGMSDRLVVNFEATEFIDSSGVRALLAARHSVEQLGGSLVVSGMSPQVGHVFEILGLTTLLCDN